MGYEKCKVMLRLGFCFYKNIPFAVCDTKLDLSCLTNDGISLWSCKTSYLFFDKSLMVLQHASKRSPASSMSSLPSWNWTPIDLTLKLVEEICTVDDTPAWYIISLVSGSLYVDMIYMGESQCTCNYNECLLFVPQSLLVFPHPLHISEQPLVLIWLFE